MERHPRRRPHQCGGKCQFNRGVMIAIGTNPQSGSNFIISPDLLFPATASSATSAMCPPTPPEHTHNYCHRNEYLCSTTFSINYIHSSFDELIRNNSPSVLASTCEVRSVCGRRSGRSGRFGRSPAVWMARSITGASVRCACVCVRGVHGVRHQNARTCPVNAPTHLCVRCSICWAVTFNAAKLSRAHVCMCVCVMLLCVGPTDLHHLHQHPPTPPMLPHTQSPASVGRERTRCAVMSDMLRIMLESATHAEHQPIEETVCVCGSDGQWFAAAAVAVVPVVVVQLNIDQLHQRACVCERARTSHSLSYVL